MPLPDALRPGLRLPAVAAPMFLISGPDLVVETCRAGVIGTFPALNARTTEALGDWMAEIAERSGPEAARWGVNLIVHRTNPRLEADLARIVEARAPLVVTSLGAVPDIVSAVHGYGGLVFHDVISRRHAEKAAAAGVDGIVAVAAGAGGHAGTLSPFALVQEVRDVFDGAIALGGAISTGAQVAAARMMGADLAWIGTRFIACREAMAPEAYKAMIRAASAADVAYTAAVSGVPANFLRPSLLAAGIDPDRPEARRSLDLGGEAKAWRDIWSAGQGAGAIVDAPPAAELCARLISEHRAALAAAARDPFSP